MSQIECIKSSPAAWGLGSFLCHRPLVTFSMPEEVSRSLGEDITSLGTTHFPLTPQQKSWRPSAQSHHPPYLISSSEWPRTEPSPLRCLRQPKASLACLDRHQRPWSPPPGRDHTTYYSIQKHGSTSRWNRRYPSFSTFQSSTHIFRRF